MDKQLIISLGREFGTGGHVIAEKLAIEYDLPLYDVNLLSKITNQTNMDYEKLMRYDEKMINVFLSKKVRGRTNSVEDNIARLQFDYLRELADSGSSFIVVGRCSEEVLKDYNSLISIFVHADKEKRCERTMELYNISQLQAYTMNKRIDLKRRMYHNHHSNNKWGHAHTYDICIDSGVLGIEKSVKALKSYVDIRISE